MSEFVPVSTVADFQNLDEGEVLEGYLDGTQGVPPPGSDRSRSYWHGWRNGMVDSQRQNPDAAFQALASDFAEQGGMTKH